jgi:hypothetical protein
MDRPFEKGATDDPSSRQGQVHGRGGERLRCRATVLKPGKTLIVAESEVYAVRDELVGQGDSHPRAGGSRQIRDQGGVDRFALPTGRTS